MNWGMNSQLNHTAAVYQKYARLLGIDRNGLIAVYPQQSKEPVIKVLVPNREVVELLRTRFGDGVTILHDDGFYLVSVNFKEEFHGF